jgi:hypothetical protein
VNPAARTEEAILSTVWCRMRLEDGSPGESP